VRGAILRRVGRDVPIGLAPLGHATTLISLEGARAGDDVELRVTGGPAVVQDVAEAGAS